MKRLPLLLSVIAVVALSASLAYWALQLFQAPQRPIAAAPVQAAPEPSMEAAAGLFGGQAVTVAVSNYQLKGVVAAGNGHGSVAILSVDNQPPKALPVGAEVLAGISVKEVQPRFVLLSEGGVIKRVELAADAPKSGDQSGGGLGNSGMPAMQPQGMPPPSRMTGSPVTAVPSPGPATGTTQAR